MVAVSNSVQEKIRFVHHLQYVSERLRCFCPSAKHSHAPAAAAAAAAGAINLRR